MIETTINRAAIAEAVMLRLTDERCPLPGPLRLSRDLEPFVAHRLSLALWRQTLDETVMAMAAADHITLHRQHFHATAAGSRWRDERFGYRIPARTGWPELRDVHLIARALDVGTDARRRRAMETGDGLRRVILEKAFGIRIREAGSLNSLRDMLARLALRSGTVVGDAAVSTRLLSVPQRRAQAATLISRGRRPATDQRLVAEIAADQIGASGTSPASLRLQLLRRHMTGASITAPPVVRKPQSAFDLGSFIIEVRNFARQCAQGWHGNRRALISRVFPALTDAHPEWGLDVTRFKTLLAEAHREGRLHLVHADLRDKKLLEDLHASAVAYRNMILHFIRVEDENSDAA